MKKNSHPTDRFLFCLALFLAVVGAQAFLADRAAAQDEPAPPPVERGVTADAYIFVRIMHNPEKDFLAPHYERVMEALRQADLLGEVGAIFDQIMTGTSDEEGAAAAKALWERFHGLLAAVDWGAFVSDELVFGVSAGFPAHTHIVLSRMEEEKAAANFAALDALMAAVAEMTQFLTREEWTHGPAKGVSLRFGAPGIPFQLAVALSGNVLIAATTNEQARAAVDLVFGGETDAEPLVATAGFREAMSLLPQAEDAVFYFEPGKIFSAFDDLENIEQLSIPIGEDALRIDTLMHAVERHIFVHDRIAAVAYTHEQRSIEEEIEIFAPGWTERPVAALVKNQPPVKDFEKFVPADALSFSVTCGFDPAALYDMLVNGFKDLAPSLAEPFLARWQMMQDGIGFHLRDDLLGCLEGRTVSVTFPAVRPTPFGNTDSVTLFRLKDYETAHLSYNRGAAALEGILEVINNPDAVEPGEQLRQGFDIMAHLRIKLLPVEMEGLDSGKKFTIGVMPFIQPVFGFHGDYFVMASSEGGLKAYLSFLEGEQPGILENEAFASLKVKLPERLSSISFKDAGASSRELAQGLSMSGMFTGWMPSSQDTLIVRRIIGLLPKLAPVVASMDFLGYQAVVKGSDPEAGYSRTWKVTTYRLED